MTGSGGQGERVGLADVQRLENAVARLRARDYRYGGGACSEAIETRLPGAVELLSGTMREAVLTRLCTAVADLYNLAGWTKKITGLPAITVGSVGLKGVDFVHSLRNPGDASEVSDLGELETRLERGEFDLVAVGRALLQDPLWAKKVRDGRSDELMNYEASAMATLY
jgi:2,4-dienoyl-CoA reductase-like NADH-dependent reductase (Old Yellow Enzyme family)